MINMPEGLNSTSLNPNNTGSAPMNKANVVSPKANPLLLLNIFDNTINVTGIVILKSSTAAMPKNELSKER
jgi:hypothetical protein